MKNYLIVTHNEDWGFLEQDASGQFDNWFSTCQAAYDDYIAKTDRRLAEIKAEAKMLSEQRLIIYKKYQQENWFDTPQVAYEEYSARVDRRIAGIMAEAEMLELQRFAVHEEFEKKLID